MKLISDTTQPPVGVEGNIIICIPDVDRIYDDDLYRIETKDRILNKLYYSRSAEKCVWLWTTFFHLLVHGAENILGVQFKMCLGSLYAVVWLADEPREFNLPTLPQLRIQYRAAKFVKGKREDGNDTIKELKWETLENRRRKTRITSLYRAHLSQKAWVDITARLEKPTYYGRNDHDFKIKCRKQKTDVDSNIDIKTSSNAALICNEEEEIDDTEKKM
ncbi:hypothetical protein ANN_07509 [Periplaneta americana]|uniref:Uncharacterized protein n=1 Tax=Periplaneta americana TaxID=6978 RepID=A0ABQ8T0F7_PERAM|nr:hypothetical protein ANN_07509 [Periplaneta americana]